MPEDPTKWTLELIEKVVSNPTYCMVDDPVVSREEYIIMATNLAEDKGLDWYLNTIFSSVESRLEIIQRAKEFAAKKGVQAYVEQLVTTLEKYYKRWRKEHPKAKSNAVPPLTEGMFRLQGEIMRPNAATNTPAALSLLTWDTNTISKMLMEKFPQTWERMTVRSIQASGNYYSSKILQNGLVAAIEECRKQASLESNVGIVAGILEQYDFPMYYVSASLLDALKHSHPPANMTWENLTLPFPGLCFMIPRGMLIEPEPTKKEIACVGIIDLPSGKPQNIPTVGPVLAREEHHLILFWILGPGGLECNDTTFLATHPLEPLTSWIDDKSHGRPYEGPPGSFSSYVAGLVANFILVMEARKELVETGVRIDKARAGKPGVYSPTWLGRNYTILREHRTPAAERQSQFTELGWRAGHFRRQRYGTSSELVKTIFIDPYIAHIRGLKPLEKVDITKI